VGLKGIFCDFLIGREKRTDSKQWEISCRDKGPALMSIKGKGTVKGARQIIGQEDD